jgi:two-component system response regulator FixJ
MSTLLSDSPDTLKATAVVYVVDDEPGIRSHLAQWLQSAGLHTECHGSADEFLRHFTQESLGCLLLSARLPGMSGLDLQAELRDRGATIPVIVLTPYADISVGVNAMKAGAFDVFEKPPREHVLLEAVWKAIARHGQVRQRHSRMAHTQKCLNTLSTREREILPLIVDGKSTKEIASELTLSPKTVDNHRASIMRRMKVHNVVDLVRLTLLASGCGCVEPRYFGESVRDASFRNADDHIASYARSTMS